MADTPTTPPTTPTPPAPDETARKAEFNKWMAEFLGNEQSTPQHTPPAPPASSGLTLADVEAFLTRREKERQGDDRIGNIEKSLNELKEQFTKSGEKRKKFSLFDFG